mmetsp:Transcript_10336/g.22370  ORF Transcript_10336/g.22370 Transcript_10336/m.22370 type:complete len:80 (+) Transcript_10336:1737-1976(+)
MPSPQYVLLTMKQLMLYGKSVWRENKVFFLSGEAQGRAKESACLATASLPQLGCSNIYFDEDAGWLVYDTVLITHGAAL